MKRLMPVVFFALVLVVTILVPLSATGDEGGRADGTATPTAPAAGDSGGVAEQGYDGDGPTPRDIPFNDDVIIDGSLCVGLDCVNGENFGFDTQRLKENNLRIHFDDTSNSASFPKNDWRIRINDSSNGGGSYFAVEDATGGRTPFRVVAGARENALYVAANGRIGIGTSTPVADLHVKNGNTPTLRLEQDGSSGFTPQTWDVAGNEANFFIRDATNGSTLPLRIRPGAPSSAIDIAANGNVGLGTASPDAQLDIEDSATVGFRLTNTAAAGQIWAAKSNTLGSFLIKNETAATNAITISDDAIDRALVLNDSGVTIGTLITPATFGTGLYVSGDVSLTNLLSIAPRATPPAGAADGAVYVDTSSQGTLCFMSGGNWFAVAGGGTCS